MTVVTHKEQQHRVIVSESGIRVVTVGVQGPQGPRGLQGEQGEPGSDATVPSHGELVGLADDDHPQYLLVDGSRELGGDLDLGFNSIVNLLVLGFENGRVRFNDIGPNGSITGDIGDVVISRLTSPPMVWLKTTDGGSSGWERLANLDDIDTLETLIETTVDNHVNASDPHGDRNYVDSLFQTLDPVLYRGTIDCSTNPNYPAGEAGYLFVVSVAGRIGGGSGPVVEAGDLIICRTDSTAEGIHAVVGSQWSVVQTNINGAVTGPVSSTDQHLAIFSGSTGKVIADGGFAIGSVATVPVSGSEVLVDGSDVLDTVISAINSDLSTKVEKSGDTMTGSLSMGGFDLDMDSGDVVNVGQIRAAAGGAVSWVSATPEGSLIGNVGDVALDSSGKVWLKVTGTGNTGWKELLVEGVSDYTTEAEAEALVTALGDTLVYGRPKSSSGVVGPSQPGLITGQTGATVNLTGNVTYYQPLWFATPTGIDRLYVENTATSAGNAYVGLYVGDEDWQPVGDPLVASAAISMASASVKTTSFSEITVQGLVLVRLNVSAATTFRVGRTMFVGGNVGGADGAIGGGAWLRSMTISETAGVAGSSPARWRTATAGNIGFEAFGWVRVSTP